VHTINHALPSYHQHSNAFRRPHSTTHLHHISILAPLRAHNKRHTIFISPTQQRISTPTLNDAPSSYQHISAFMCTHTYYTLAPLRAHTHILHISTFTCTHVLHISTFTCTHTYNTLAHSRAHTYCTLAPLHAHTHTTQRTFPKRSKKGALSGSGDAVSRCNRTLE